jgi:hypothetical protein
MTARIGCYENSDDVFYLLIYLAVHIVYNCSYVNISVLAYYLSHLG